jgi:fumarate reductase subunit C
MNDALRQQRYQKPISAFWWLRRRAYLIFALREISCVFVAWFVVFLLLLIHAVDQGAEQYRQFVTWSAHSWVSGMNAISAMFLLLHAITWFHQTPQAFALRLGGRRVPKIWIGASVYLLWFFVSAVVAWAVLGR